MKNPKRHVIRAQVSLCQKGVTLCLLFFGELVCVGS